MYAKVAYWVSGGVKKSVGTLYSAPVTGSKANSTGMPATGRRLTRVSVGIRTLRISVDPAAVHAGSARQLQRDRLLATLMSYV
jgi:hypothetical protein